MTDEKSGKEFALPELPSEMVSGFLTEFWNTQEPLPRITSFERAIYYCQRAIGNLAALPMSNTLTVLTIAVSLFLFGGFILVLQNVDRMIAEAGSAMNLTIYLKPDVPDPAVNEFIAELRNDKSLVKSATFTSKAEALDLFRDELGKKSPFLEGLDGENPLPASIDVVLQVDELGVRSMDRVIDDLSKRDVVEEVVYGSKWADKTRAVLKVFRFFGFVILLLVLSIIVFLIANTIKLVIYSRRDEIGIMKLVGATDRLIKIPFLLGGLIQGFVGSIVALGLLTAVFSFTEYQLRNSAVFGVAVPRLVFISPTATVGILLIGLVIGAIGSLFALGRFVNV